VNFSKAATMNPTKPKTINIPDKFKPIVLNNVNWLTCEDLYGEDSDMWRGKPHRLYRDPNIMFGNKRWAGFVSVPRKSNRTPTHPRAYIATLVTSTRLTLLKWTALVKDAIAAVW